MSRIRQTPPQRRDIRNATTHEYGGLEAFAKDKRCLPLAESAPTTRVPQVLSCPPRGGAGAGVVGVIP